MIFKKKQQDEKEQLKDIDKVEKFVKIDNVIPDVDNFVIEFKEVELHKTEDFKRDCNSLVNNKTLKLIIDKQIQLRLKELVENKDLKFEEYRTIKDEITGIIKLNDAIKRYSIENI